MCNGSKVLQSTSKHSKYKVTHLCLLIDQSVTNAKFYLKRLKTVGEIKRVSADKDSRRTPEKKM